MAGRKPKARYLQVRGWWDFQHYPDKVEAGWTPPWIKNYAALLEDYEYNELSEVDRGRLHRIWLLAARLDNKIPWDERFIRTAIRASASFKLQPFIHSGMLSEWDVNAATRPPKKPRKPRNQAKSALEEVYTPPIPEESRAEEKRKEAALLLETPTLEVVPEPVAGWSGLPIDFEKDRELSAMLPSLKDVTDDSMDALRKAATGVAFGRCRKVRESIERRPRRTFGVGYAVNALKSERQEAA